MMMLSFAEVLPYLLTGKCIYRQKWPFTFYEVDGAEGGKYGIWKHDTDEDEMTHNWKFGIADLGAKDWALRD